MHSFKEFDCSKSKIHGVGNGLYQCIGILVILDSKLYIIVRNNHERLQGALTEWGVLENKLYDIAITEHNTYWYRKIEIIVT